jgi:hypothetical protein
MNLVDNQLEKDITLKELFELIKPEIIKNLFQTFNFNDIQERKKYFQNHLNFNDDINYLTEKYNIFKDNLIKQLNENIDNIFNNEYKYSKFKILKNFLKKEYTNIIKNHYKHIDIWFNSYLDKFKYEYCGHPSLYHFQGYITHNFNKYIYCDIYNFSITDNDLLIKNDE